VEWVETTGRTVAEAKDAALDRLGIDETDAEFEVLEEPRMGLFGRLRAEARVRARVRPTQPRPKENRRDRPRRSKSKPAAPTAAAEPVEDGRTPAGGDRPSRARREPRPARKKQPTVSAVAATSEQEGAPVDQDVPLQEQAEVARTFLVGLLASFETDGVVDVRELDEDTVELAVDGGEHVKLLIGPGGATLTAVQEITRRVVQRQTGARNGRLLVDVSGYRTKRKAALERFVKGVAADVQASGVAKALEPMHAADRKVVHDTVNGLDGVSTTSEGEEPRRRVVISPS